MRKLLGLVAVALTALLAIASPASSRDEFTCNGVFAGARYGNVVVPAGGACTLVDSTVAGDVKALRDAYFQSTNTSVQGGVYGNGAQTLFLDSGSRISGGVNGNGTVQVFIFNSKVTRSIVIDKTSEIVEICGTTVLKGGISVQRSGSDIRIGNSWAADCRRNAVRRGDLEVKKNIADVEFAVRGNSIRKGNLEVSQNSGSVQKFVEGNTGGDRLHCKGNSRPFAAGANAGWDRNQGQCAGVRRTVVSAR